MVGVDNGGQFGWDNGCAGYVSWPSINKCGERPLPPPPPPPFPPPGPPEAVGCADGGYHLSILLGTASFLSAGILDPGIIYLQLYGYYSAVLLEFAPTVAATKLNWRCWLTGTCEAFCDNKAGVHGCGVTWDGAKSMRAPPLASSERSGKCSGGLPKPHCEVPADACAAGWEPCLSDGNRERFMSGES